MGTLSLALWLTTLAFVSSGFSIPQNYECPITKAPVPPLPWRPVPNTTDRYFPLGTPGLWANVTNHWTLHLEQNKLPYFSEYFDYKKSGDPPLAVVARRLDVPAPLVWAKWVNGARPDPSGRDFMTTSLDIPSTGCWEISAHFTPARDKVETLTYIVLVE